MELKRSDFYILSIQKIDTIKRSTGVRESLTGCNTEEAKSIIRASVQIWFVMIGSLLFTKRDNHFHKTFIWDIHKRGVVFTQWIQLII